MIFIAGAIGFVGQHLVNGLLAKGLRITCLMRSEAVGAELSARGVRVVHGDITDAATLDGVLSPDDFLVHLVGIIAEKGKASFQTVHVDGTLNLVNAAKKAGVRHFFYQSALGADRASWSGYLRTKAEAEDIVKQSGLGYTIFRPSLIIGPWDGFTKKLVDMMRLSPVLPIPGEGGAKFQPIYIRDWLKCIEMVISDPGKFVGVYDIGGPEHLSYKEIVETLSRSMGHNRPAINIPIGLMKLGAAFFESVLFSPPVTSDQLRLLEQDNVCDKDVIEKTFGFRPVRYEEALKEFIKG